MHGLVNRSFQLFVSDTFGREVWERLINMMYDKKGNLTPIGKKVMEHRIKEKEGK
jgi:hypothetical protein